MNPQKFQKLLDSVKGWREQAFILALAERASPNACLFFEASGLAEHPQALRLSIDDAWRLILDPGENEEESDERQAELLDRLDALQPGDSASDSYGLYPARDVFTLLEIALLAMINDESRRCCAASQQSLATVTSFIEFSEGEGKSESALIKLFDQHPLVERELSFQEELYDLLRAAHRPAPELIKSLRLLASDDSVSNIGVCLDD